ncbi:MAG: prepilin-type N-terminal cleavage/methylation domain-containing protein [Planctomycetota bacterium]
MHDTAKPKPVTVRAQRAAAPTRRPGLTLIELLVVMGILVLLVSSAIPILNPSSDERKLREATRGINTFIGAQKARAVQANRPAGVMFKKLSQDTGDAEDNAVCVQLYAVEQPAPYAGFDDTSRVMLSRPDPASTLVLLRFVARGTANVSDGLPVGWDADLVPPGVFRPGDVVVMGGVDYQLRSSNLDNVSVDATGYYAPATGALVQLTALPLDGATPDWAPVYESGGGRVDEAATITTPYWTEPLAYQIRRLPAPTSAPPFELPPGTAVDLRASGTDTPLRSSGRDVRFFVRDERELGASYEDVVSNDTPVILLFSPDGTVSRLNVNLGQPTGDGIDGPDNNSSDDDDIIAYTPVTSNVYFLVGARENIPAPTAAVEADFRGYAGSDRELEQAKAKINWLSGESRWVVIGGQTGAVATAPNSFVNPVPIAADAGLTITQRRDIEIGFARNLAKQKVKEGGR